MVLEPAHIVCWQRRLRGTRIGKGRRRRRLGGRYLGLSSAVVYICRSTAVPWSSPSDTLRFSAGGHSERILISAMQSSDGSSVLTAGFKKDADYVFYELTRSICPVCRAVIDAQILIREQGLHAEALHAARAFRRNRVRRRRHVYEFYEVQQTGYYPP
jgi:hypothetical protein